MELVAFGRRQIPRPAATGPQQPDEPPALLGLESRHVIVSEQSDLGDRE
jgi:hypothetical protein